MVFESREEAGTLLADKLKKYGKNCVVLAIPRGGVVVGAQIAHALSGRKWYLPIVTELARTIEI